MAGNFFTSIRVLIFFAILMSVIFLLHLVHFSIRFDEQANGSNTGGGGGGGGAVIDMLRNKGLVKAHTHKDAASSTRVNIYRKPKDTDSIKHVNPYSSSTHSFYERAKEAAAGLTFTGHRDNIDHAAAALEIHQQQHGVGVSAGGGGENSISSRSSSSSSGSDGSSKSDGGYNLPGAGQHPILRLSDAALQSTAVSTLMSWYGESDGGGTCSGDFGNQLIARWRDTNKTNCAPTTSSSVKTSSTSSVGSGKQEQQQQQQQRGGARVASTSSGALGSSIDCYLMHQTRHHGHGDNLCHMKNVAVDMSLFADDGKTRPVVKQYVDTRHAQQPYIKFPKGFVSGDCNTIDREWRAQVMPGWNADWTVNAFQKIDADSGSGSGSGSGSASVCDEWVEHPVLVTQRDTFANFFHDSEDFFNVFVAMAVLEWEPGNTQMYLTDLYPEGPFWDMWNRVYSQGALNNPAKTAMTAWDLRQRFGNPEHGKKVCFRDLAVGIYGPAAPMTVASWDTPCRRTALIRAYSDFVIRGLRLSAQTHYAQPVPSKTVVVTYMARRPSKEWPEKKYCDSQHSFFLCDLWAKFGERRLGRMIRNDKEVVAALKGLEQETFPNAGKVIVQDVDYNVLTFEEQIAIDLQTDVMIGPHGAGLMHNIFMRDRAALIELFVDGSSVNRHFHNMAYWFGRSYSGLSISNPIKIPELLRIVKGAIQGIDTSKY